MDLLLNGFDADVAALRTAAEDELTIRCNQVQKQLQQFFGLTEENAQWVIETWLEALGRKKPTEQTKKAEEDPSFVERLKDCFDAMVVYKDLNQNNFISSFKRPSFMRDFILKNFPFNEIYFIF